MRFISIWILSLNIGVWACACNDSNPGGNDASLDSDQESGADSGSDSIEDAPGAGEDSTADAGTDYGPDASGDGGADEGDACPPSGQTYYVSALGDDLNLGTEDSPWRTIQKAADTMVASDTAIVLEGSYIERVKVAHSGAACKPITFQAQGHVVMRGFSIRKIVNSPYQVLPVDFITIRGFEIADTDYRRWDSKQSAGIYIFGSNVIVEGNYLHDCTLHGIDLDATPEEPTTTSQCIIRNNRLYHNEMVGINVNGRNHLIEGNEVWGTVQCHPKLMEIEDHAADNPGHVACPNYPGLSGLDADGMRFFGQGHVFRKNHIHDIPFGPPGINPAQGDYNGTPHIDCFQTWSGTYNEMAQNVLFEQNLCENLQTQAERENGHGFMLAGGANELTLINNIIMAYGGVETGGTGGAHHLYIYNNLWINNLDFHQFYPMAIGLQDVAYAKVKNNIFYDQPYHTIIAIGDTTGQELDYNLAYNSDGSAPDCLRVDNYVCQDPPPAHDLWAVNPQFEIPDQHDYHLQSTSPAIDAGITLPTVLKDYDDRSRPQGNGYDIGPFECD